MIVNPRVAIGRVFTRTRTRASSQRFRKRLVNAGPYSDRSCTAANPLVNAIA